VLTIAATPLCLRRTKAGTKTTKKENAKRITGRLENLNTWPAIVLGGGDDGVVVVVVVATS